MNPPRCPEQARRSGSEICDAGGGGAWRPCSFGMELQPVLEIEAKTEIDSEDPATSAPANDEPGRLREPRRWACQACGQLARGGSNRRARELMDGVRLVEGEAALHEARAPLLAMRSRMQDAQDALTQAWMASRRRQRTANSAGPRSSTRGPAKRSTRPCARGAPRRSRRWCPSRRRSRTRRRPKLARLGGGEPIRGSGDRPRPADARPG